MRTRDHSAAVRGRRMREQDDWAEFYPNRSGFSAPWDGLYIPVHRDSVTGIVLAEFRAAAPRSR
ncbi:hypothetical protein [Streptomyces sp. AC555_RSS877]|uniref:hypothetical protein n=1 Tax=Streptomyces sp. AC555_RSS877 TaxID=2823688 RepID=UPI001C27C049|nr:hypothetical protein [Streptomyces sp. AC555_RSS877]